jgi:hypothetical protein
MKTAWERLRSESLKTEARRIARNAVKTELKRQGIKVSHVEASEITKAAYHLLHCEPTIIEDARRNLRRHK